MEEQFWSNLTKILGEDEDVVLLENIQGIGVVIYLTEGGNKAHWEPESSVIDEAIKTIDLHEAPSLWSELEQTINPLQIHCIELHCIAFKNIYRNNLLNICVSDIFYNTENGIIECFKIRDAAYCCGSSKTFFFSPVICTLKKHMLGTLGDFYFHSFLADAWKCHIGWVENGPPGETVHEAQPKCSLLVVSPNRVSKERRAQIVLESK